MNQTERPYKEIGERLEEFRKSLGLDRKSLSEKLGMTVSHYGNLAGGIKLVSNRHTIKLIDLYPDCNLTYILGGYGSLRLGDSNDEQDKRIHELEIEIRVLKDVLKTFQKE